MKYSEARQGRVFVIRLEDGDVIHEEIEKFAREKSVKAGVLIILGGADQGSKLVVGPEQGRKKPIKPLQYILDNVHEAAGTGTIFPGEKGLPVLHMHIACGRKDQTVTGCVRRGVNVLQLNLDTTPPPWTSLANIGTSYGVAWDALYGRAYTLLTPVAGGTELTGIDGTIGSATYGQVVASTSGLFSSGLIERWSLSPDGRTAAVLTVLNRNLILVDTDPASPGYMSWVNTGPAPAGPGVFPVTTRCAFTPDSAQLLVTIQTGAGAPGEIARYDLNSGQWIDHNPGMFGTQNIGLQSAPAVSVPSAPGDVEVANDGTYAIVVGWNGPGGIIRIDLDPVAPQVWSAAVINSPVSLAGDARVCAISPDSEHFVTYGSGDVLVFEAAGFLAGQVSLPGVLSVNTISWE